MPGRASTPPPPSGPVSGPSIPSARPSLSAVPPLEVDATPLLRDAGRRTLLMLEHLGNISTIFWRALRAMTKRPLEIEAAFYQMESLGVRSVGIASITAVFIGMVMAVQFAAGLQKFGGMEYTGRIIGLSFSRELAPTLTAVIVGGRIGSGMASEVGSMAVTEQIDAIRALGADPIKKLVVPRLAAAVVVMPVLSVFSLVLGFGGAMWITQAQFRIPAEFFLRSALGSTGVHDLLSGICKTPFFGAIIALVGCYFGLRTTGGTEGVGNSTTRSVVVISISILIADFLLTKAFLIVWPQ